MVRAFVDTRRVDDAIQRLEAAAPSPHRELALVLRARGKPHRSLEVLLNAITVTNWAPVGRRLTVSLLLRRFASGPWRWLFGIRAVMSPECLRHSR